MFMHTTFNINALVLQHVCMLLQCCACGHTKIVCRQFGTFHLLGFLCETYTAQMHIPSSSRNCYC